MAKTHPVFYTLVLRPTTAASAAAASLSCMVTVRSEVFGV